MQIGGLQSISAIVAMALMSPAGWLSDEKEVRVGIVGGFGLISAGWYVFFDRRPAVAVGRSHLSLLRAAER